MKNEKNLSLDPGRYVDTDTGSLRPENRNIRKDSGGLIKVGIVNNPPSESGYRAANEDFETVFTEANGYKVSTFYSLKNDEQLNAAQQFITDGVDYLLISSRCNRRMDQCP